MIMVSLTLWFVRKLNVSWRKNTPKLFELDWTNNGQVIVHMTYLWPDSEILVSKLEDYTQRSKSLKS